MPESIVKRDGTTVPFRDRKIHDAVAKASLASTPMTATEIEGVVSDVLARITDSPTVEQVQDLVELALIGRGHASVAKAYILYRADHARRRDARNALMEIYRELTFVPSKDVDLKRENANVNGDTSMGTMLRYGSEGSKHYCNRYVLPPDIAEAHVCGDIHIHDEDFYTLTETCCQIDPLPLFERGFSTGHGFLRPPKSILTRAALACIVIQANQNEMHGGQSIPNFDFAMAPGVRHTFERHLGEQIGAYYSATSEFIHEDYGDYSHRPTVKEKTDGAMKAAWPCALELKAPEELKGHYGSYWYALQWAYPRAYERTERETYQAMEAVVHNLNTMNSRAGAQVPFSSLNYGTDTSPEGRMVTRQLLLATEAGLGAGETAIFPVQIFKMKRGVNYDEGDPNHDLFQLALRVSARRLFPNFSNLDAPFNAQYYRPGDYDSEVAYMGCRTRVMGNVHDPSRETTCGRGNLSFTSVNLPRLAILADRDPDKFLAGLDRVTDLCVRQLLHRLSIQSARRVRNYPFLMGEDVWIDSAKLGWDDEVGEVLKHGTLTVGFIGLAEAMVALFGKHHGEDQTVWDFAYSTIKRMRQRMDKESQERKLNFTLIATPAEGLSGRFVKLDRERFGEIPGVTDRKYYTNSFHIPVYFPIKAFRKIDLEAPFHALTNAGHITYVELDGDPSKNLEAYEAIVRYMHDRNVGYGSVNFPLDRDPVCGYVGVIGDVCPRCGRREGEAVDAAVLEKLNHGRPARAEFRGYGRD